MSVGYNRIERVHTPPDTKNHPVTVDTAQIGQSISVDAMKNMNIQHNGIIVSHGIIRQRKENRQRQAKSHDKSHIAVSLSSQDKNSPRHPI